MNLDDERYLISQLNESSTEAFDRLFQKYHKHIFNFCKRILYSKIEAEEIVQSVFLALWENRAVVDPNKSFEKYIFSLTRYQVIDLIRKKLCRQTFAAQLIVQEAASDWQTEEQLYFKELYELLQSLIQQLPERRREIFLLSRRNGISYKEIALQLNISENTVDTQIRRALEFLRAGIDRHSN